MIGTLVFSTVLLWFIATLVTAWFPKWRVWWALNGLLLIAIFASLATDFAPLDMVFGMSIYFWPVALVSGALIWLSRRATAALRHTKEA